MTINTAKAARMGVVAVAVAADYMAQQELAAKLEAINRGVNRLVEWLDAEGRATLDVAAETIAEAQAAVAGERTPPVSLGLDATASRLRRLLARERRWVEQLAKAGERIEEPASQDKLDTDGVPINVFEEIIGMEGVHEAPRRYAERVSNYYRALVLDSHLAVLSEAEATLASDDADLNGFEKALNRRLRVNALRQENLADATQAIAHEPLTSKFFQGKLKEAHAVERVVTAVAFGVRASARRPEMVNTNGRQEIVVEVLESGDLKLIAS